MRALAEGGDGVPDASVVITTKDRLEDLRRAVRSALEQTVAVEVIVMDDGSADGTTEAIRAEFPEARVCRSERSEGCVAQRNHGVEMARAPIVVFIDDDAVFSSQETVAQALAGFDHPRVGGVAIPIVDVNTGPEVRQQAPNADAIWSTPTYDGGASALRTDLFRRLGGYRLELVEQHEEADYSLRLLDRGYLIRLGQGDPILHYEGRSLAGVARRYFYIGRNEVLFTWMNVPSPYLPLRLAAVTAKALLIGLRDAHPGAVLRGLIAAYRSLRRQVRRPVSRQAYRLSRRLKRAPALRGPVETLLPSPGGRP